MTNFFYIYRGYKQSDHDEFINEYANAGNKNDLVTLVKIYNELHQKKDPTSKIHQAEVRSRIRLLQHFEVTNKIEKKVILPEDSETITHYLNSLQSWTIQEMQLFTNTLDYIDYEQKNIFFKTLVKSMKKYEDYDRGRYVICVMLTNMIHELIVNNEVSYAEKLIEGMNNISNQDKEIFFKIVYKYYRGLLKILKNEKEEGTQLAQSAIEILNEFDQPHQAKIFESILNQVLH